MEIDHVDTPVQRGEVFSNKSYRKYVQKAMLSSTVIASFQLPADFQNPPRWQPSLTALK